MKIRIMIGLASALALAACNDAVEDTEAAPTGAGMDVAAQETAPPAEVASAPVASTPQEFVAMAASSDMYEIQAADMARKNGKSQTVKDFAAMMMTDHKASSAKLQEAAAKATPAVTVPASLMPDHQALLDELAGAGSGAGFDAVYARQQQAAHQQALALLRGYSGNGADDPLAAFASATAPVVERHLGHAQELPGS